MKGRRARQEVTLHAVKFGNLVNRALRQAFGARKRACDEVNDLKAALWY